MPSKRFVNITQQVIDDLSAAPFGCYRRTTRRSWKNLRGRVPVTLRGAPPNQVGRTIMSLQDKLDAFKADFEAGNTGGELTFFPILPYISELADQPTTLQLQVRMLCAQPGTQETGRLGRF